MRHSNKKWLTYVLVIRIIALLCRIYAESEVWDMAVPARRTSKTRKRLRRTHFKLSAKGLVSCSNCGAMIQSHRVCPECGYYNGKKVIDIKSSAK